MNIRINSIIALLCAGLAGCQNGGQFDTRADMPAYRHFIGAMHEHSGYSDGQVGTKPADYYAAGKALGLDFVAGSEHSDNAHLPLTADTDCVSAALPDCITPPPEGLLKWDETAAMAESVTDDSFTAIRGFEWTSDRFGHINVYFSSHDLNAKTGPGYLLSMDAFWLWFGMSVDALGGEDGVMVFNHPGREDALHAACNNLGPLADSCGSVYNGDPAYTWNDFEYRPELAERVVGIEMYGKSNHYYDGDNGAPPGGWYAHALDQGWYLGPVGAEDEHGREWGQPQRAKTVILAEQRDAESLKAAMLARRFYALAHQYNAVRLELVATDGAGQRFPMGSRLSHAPGESLALTVSVMGVEKPRIEFVGVGGQPLHSSAGKTAELSIGASSEREEWVYVRVIDTADADGDERRDEVVAISAPIWFRAE